MHRDGKKGQADAQTAGPDRSPCTACPVRELAFCASLDARSQAVLRQMSQQIPVTTGQLLAEEGQINAPFMMVVAGVVELAKRLPDGRRQVMGFRFPGEIVTVPCSETASRVSAHAVTPGTVCQIDVGAFWHLVRSDPKISLRLLAVACEEIAATQDQIMLLRRKSATERVAHFIAHLPGRGQADGNVVEMVMKRQDMADYLGLTTETVSRALATLRAEEIVHLADRRHAVIDDPAALEQLAHGGEAAGAGNEQGENSENGELT